METDALVDYLYEHKSEAGDGGSFKTTTFTGAATSIAHLLTQGPAKTAAMCKNKYDSVCHIIWLSDGG